MHVGLLEDDIAIQEMLLLVLKDEGYVVTNYPDAQACLQALAPVTEHVHSPIDLLVIDWHLGGNVSGTEVIKQIRLNPALTALPIILTTAATFNDIEELKRLQVALLEKPFSVDDMTLLIKNLIHTKSI